MITYWQNKYCMYILNITQVQFITTQGPIEVIQLFQYNKIITTVKNKLYILQNMEQK